VKRLSLLAPKAQALGVKEIYIDDLREEYAKDYVFPMFRANAIYEGEYLLGTFHCASIDRQAFN
jgi:argininosuccinate synthase